MGRISSENVRPLVPRLLLREESGCQEIQGAIRNRFNLPAAKLVNLPAYYLKGMYSQVVSAPDDSLEDYLGEDRISYTALSSIKYNTTDGHTIHLTTLLLSRKAALLEYQSSENIITSDGSQAMRKVILQNNIEAMCFFNPARSDIRNQLVFLKERRYYVTSGSDLSLSSLIELVSNHLVI